MRDLRANATETILTDATDADGRQLIASVRNLVEKIEITPMSPEPGNPFSLTPHGDLARFMKSTVATLASCPVVSGCTVGNSVHSARWQARGHADMSSWLARLEQSLGQAEGFQMTLVVLPDDDDGDERRDLEESFTPRFRR